MGNNLHPALPAAALGILVTLLALPGLTQVQKPKTAAVPTLSRVGVTKVSTILTCPTDPADATLTVAKSPEGYHFGHVAARTAAYNSTGCPSYIVDVVIPPDYVSPYGAIKIYAGASNFIELHQSKTACQASKLSWTVYKRVPRPITQSYGHPIVANESKQATWKFDADIGDYCDSGVSYEIKLPTPEAAAGQATVYRVIVLPKANGAAVPARVSWQWDY